MSICSNRGHKSFTSANTLLWPGVIGVSHLGRRNWPGILSDHWLINVSLVRLGMSMLDDSCSSEGRAHLPLNKLRTSHACFLSCHPSFCSRGGPLTCHCVHLLWTLTWDLSLHSEDYTAVVAAARPRSWQVVARVPSVTPVPGCLVAAVSGGQVHWPRSCTHTEACPAWATPTCDSRHCSWNLHPGTASSPSLAHQPLGLFHNNSIAFKNSSSSSSYQKHLLGPTRLSPGGQGWYRDSELFRVNGPYRHDSG